MSEDDTSRTVRIERLGDGNYVATNGRGASINFSSGGRQDFSPVELLLAAIGGCTGIDTDVATTRHAEPTEFAITVAGNKTWDELGSRMTDLAVTFQVSFPAGAGGDAARAILPRAVKLSHDRLCTVSRTVEIGTPITSTIADA